MKYRDTDVMSHTLCDRCTLINVNVINFDFIYLRTT